MKYKLVLNIYVICVIFRQHMHMNRITWWIHVSNIFYHFENREEERKRRVELEMEIEEDREKEESEGKWAWEGERERLEAGWVQREVVVVDLGAVMGEGWIWLKYYVWNFQEIKKILLKSSPFWKCQGKKQLAKEFKKVVTMLASLRCHILGYPVFTRKTWCE